MDPRAYYYRVIDRLRNCYQFSSHLIATGEELVGEGGDPAFPSVATPVDQLDRFTLEHGLEVHIPVVGERSRSVLMPLDIEIFMGQEQHRLYSDRTEQQAHFEKSVPVLRFVEDLLHSRGMPYLLDYTPSGGHILFQNILGQRPTEEAGKIGFVEDDLATACEYSDSGDIRRFRPTSMEAAQVFSGLGRLAEYMAILAMQAFQDHLEQGLPPLTISDSEDMCINFDNTWSEGPPYFRAIRSPFSLHMKNREKYGKRRQPPLVDVVGSLFDGREVTEVRDLDRIVDCMWDLDKAAEHAESFSGFIPCSNDSLADFVGEYRDSDLYRFHLDFDSGQNLPRGRALELAKREGNIAHGTRSLLDFPNPSALQPKKLVGFVHDFLVHAGWHPKHIANILRDLYQNPDFNWVQDFFRHPAVEKANFWARTYSAVALFNTGAIRA